MPIDVAQSAAQALVDHLAATVQVAYNGVTGPLRVRRGWNEDTESYSTVDGPVAAVTAIGEPRASYHVPFTAERAATPFTWKVADLDISLQLDLWAPHRHTRDVVAEAVGRALHNDIPHRGGLYLTHSDYYGRPLTIHAEGGRSLDQDNLTPSAAEWRTMWTLRAESAKVVQAATPQQLNWELRFLEGAVLLESYSISP